MGNMDIELAVIQRSHVHALEPTVHTSKIVIIVHAQQG